MILLDANINYCNYWIGVIGEAEAMHFTQMWILHTVLIITVISG